MTKGMSVVGPRPALPNEVATYNDYQRQRLLVKPGMTCYWQTRRNRDSITFDEWVDLDLCEDGDFCPIEWVGRQGSVYQGNLVGDGKKNAQKIFEAELKACAESGRRSKGYDWSSMELLVDYLVRVASELRSPGNNCER